MLTSVLLHVGGLVTVIIVSIVISIFSSRKKEKKRASFFSQFTPQPESFDNTPLDAEFDATPADSEPQSFIVNSPEGGSTNQPTGKRKKHNQQSAKPAECPKQAAPAIDDTPYSEYSLKDPEAAKRAIIYSEILKPKF